MKTLHSMLVALALIVVGLVSALMAYSAPSAAPAGAGTLVIVPAASYPAPVVQDSWIDANQATGNFGGDASLHVGQVMDPASGQLGERQALVQFDLSGLPAGAVIVNATLQLFQTAAFGFDAYQVHPEAALAGWQESVVNWGNRPPTGSQGDQAVTLDYTSGWKQWDVTQIVLGWQTSHAPNYGIALVGLNPAGMQPTERVFNSRNATANLPTLTITYQGGAGATMTATPTATRTSTVVAPTTTATRTSTVVTPTTTPSPPSPTPTPTLIPVVTDPPFIFNPNPLPPPFAMTNVVSVGHYRITQGLDEDITGGVFHDKIAGKDALVRFWAYTSVWNLGVNSAACEIRYWNGIQDVLLGVVPALTAHPSVYVVDLYPSDFGRFDCWVPGWMLSAAGMYKFRAIVNTSDGYSTRSWLGGYREFLPTSDYLGLFLFPAFIPPSVNPNALDTLSANYYAHLLGITLQTAQREWPLRAGIEEIRMDGLNPHAAGLRYYLSANPYSCSVQEAQTDNLCDGNQRAEGNRQLNLFNMWAWIANSLLGKNVDRLDWGEVVVPFDIPWGGQSCWGDQRVAGQGISLYDYDGYVLVQEVSHCLGLVNVGPHANVTGKDPSHSTTGDILMWGAGSMVNLRTRKDERAVEAVMNGGFYRGDDQSMMEGFEWNRLRGIFLGSDPCAGGACAAAVGQGRDAGAERFFLSGKVDLLGRWTTDLSMVITAPVPLPLPPASGAYAVVVLDGSGHELVRWPFDVSFETTHGESADQIPLNFTVPYPNGAGAVRVVRGSTVLAELRPPARGPHVAFQSVSASSTEVQAAWSAGHPDSASLTYSLYFSPDDGVTRLPIATALTATSYIWPTGLAQGTAHARLIVAASDGFHTVEATSTAFSIPAKPPAAWISAPATGRLAPTTGSGHISVPITPTIATLVAGRPIALRGSGADLNDGVLDGAGLRWASDRQGPLGIGQQLAAVLQPGVHVLTLQAVSSAGLVGSDQVTVTVQADTDGDGLPDPFELAHSCLNRNGDDAQVDQDNDSLAALHEFQLGTNPCMADTDGDGYSDGAEVQAGSNPLDRSSVPLPLLAQAPAPLRFGGCGLLPPPAPQTVTLQGLSASYAAVADVPWLHVSPNVDGSLQVAVFCQGLPGDAAGTILLTAASRQPLRLTVELVFGKERVYLPTIVRGRG